MSDTTDPVDGWRRRFRERSNPLREAMQAVVDEHATRAGLKALRERTSGGTDLATLVDAGREERT
jgi:hypothetical protein